MKNLDGLLLLLVAIVFSGLSWLFWTGLKEDAFSILSTIVIVVLLYDNFRLRNKLKEK